MSDATPATSLRDIALDLIVSRARRTFVGIGSLVSRRADCVVKVYPFASYGYSDILQDEDERLVPSEVKREVHMHELAQRATQHSADWNCVARVLSMVLPDVRPPARQPSAVCVPELQEVLFDPEGYFAALRMQVAPGREVGELDAPCPIVAATIGSSLALLHTHASLCHGDFHVNNILVGPKGTWVLDWARGSTRAELTDDTWTNMCVYDLASAAKDFGDKSPRCVQAMVDGYAHAMGDDLFEDETVLEEMTGNPRAVFHRLVGDMLDVTDRLSGRCA